ncbi:MAG: hypothetical protein WDW36_003074 [Sanguina aurantia]
MQITMSVMMVVAGCLVAGVGDLSFDMVGYACAFASCAMQAAYLLLVEFQGSATDTSELLYYNSITSLPLLIPIAYMAGVLKGVVAVALGFFLLGGIKTSFWNTCGIVINTLGGSTTQ